MASARDYCIAALVDAGVAGENQPIPAAQADRALRMLNRIIAGWNVDGLTKPVLTSDTATVVGASLTIGPTGDIVTTARPVQVVAVAYEGTPLSIVTTMELTQFVSESGTPSRAAYSPTEPDGTITLWPTPSGSGAVTVTWQQELGEYGINDTVPLTREMATAMQWGLASQIAKAYGYPRADLEAEYGRILSAIKVNNVNFGRMSLTPGLAGNRGSRLYSL